LLKGDFGQLTATIKLILVVFVVAGLVVMFSAALKPEPKLFSRKPLTNHE